MKLEQLQKSAHFRQVDHNVQEPATKTPGSKSEFDRLLTAKVTAGRNDVKFSAHAAERLANRNIILSEQDMTRLTTAVNQVAEKGGRESLVVMGDLSFVVSVENKTIITAMQNQVSGKNKIFTNIDSALII